MEKEYVRYSEAFKRQVIQDLESGKLRSLGHVRRVYGIRGSTTVERWVKKYGSEAIQPKIIRVETMKERDELKEARKRIRDLEAAVADAHIDYCLEKGYLQVACERMGVDMENFKKKNAMTLSTARKPRKGR